MSKQYGVNYEFWKAEKWALILLVIGLILSDTLYTSLILGISGLLFVVKLPRMKLVLNGEHLLLSIAFFSVFFINIIHYNSTFYWSAYLCLTPLFMYSLGKYFMRRWENEDNLLLIWFLLAVSLGSVHISVTIVDIMENGIVNPERVLGIGVDNDSQRAVTQRVIELSLCFFGFSMLMYKPLNNFQHIAKFLFVVIGVLALLCGLHYVSRTCLFFFLVNILIGVLVTRNKNTKNKGSGIIVFILIILLIVFIVFSEQSTIFQLFQLYQNRGMNNKDIMSAGGRQERWLEALDVIFAHPWGTKSDFFAHNLWLDIGMQYGIIPFIFLVWFSISNFRKAFLIVIRKQESLLVRLCVSSFSVLFFLSCFTEPIHVGAPNYLFLYGLFCGMINAIFKRVPQPQTNDGLVVDEA